MRLLTFRHAGRVHAGVRRNDAVLPVTEIASDLPDSVQGILAGGHLPRLAAAATDSPETGISLADVDFLPVVPRPGKMLCIGRNYAAHAAEGGADTPAFPEIFMRAATSLVGHGAPIVRPRVSEKLDYEGEFAFVVGRTCRHVNEEAALDVVAGYTLFNDASVRDYQRFASQWTPGKNFDGTGAFGPELVTADELPPGLAGLTLTTHLNGEQVQIGNVDDLVFPVARLISIITRCMTLEAGDVVVTGTPSGVGFARKPPLWMRPADTVRVSVQGLGELVNTVVDEPAA